jgi:hypothetical protein
MKKYLFLISVMILGLLSVLKLNTTHSYFSDTAVSGINTFSTAEVFPSGYISPTLTIAPTITTAPTLAPTGIQVSPGDVVINEINWAGSIGDSIDEWIELKNNTNISINIVGWTIENLGENGSTSSNITIATTSAIIPANGLFLIAHKIKTNSKLNIDPDYITRSISLSNDGEQLKLFSNNSILIDSANSSTGMWFEGSNSPLKKSMERKTPAGDGTVSTNWQTATTHTNMKGNGATDEYATPKAVNGH